MDNMLGTSQVSYSSHGVVIDILSLELVNIGQLLVMYPDYFIS